MKMPGAGLEPARAEARGILSPLCLPISPPRPIAAKLVRPTRLIQPDSPGQQAQVELASAFCTPSGAEFLVLERTEAVRLDHIEKFSAK